MLLIFLNPDLGWNRGLAALSEVQDIASQTRNANSPIDQPSGQHFPWSLPDSRPLD